MLLATSGCSRDANQAAAARASLPVGSVADEGFDQARWGMTRQQVRQLYPTASVERECLRAEDTARSPRTILSFGFADDQLSYVQQLLVFIGAVRFDPYEAKLHELRGTLTERFGPPKPPPLLLEIFQEAWSETSWESAQTLAVLRFEPGVNVQYYSRQLYQPQTNWQERCGLRRAAVRP